jgi:predicted RecB family nuclease
MFLVTGSSLPGAAAPAAPRIVHSASDVVRAAECEHGLLRRVDELLGRAPALERPADATLERTRTLGAAQQQRALAAYRDRHGTAPDDGGPGGVAEIAAPRTSGADDLAAAHAATLAALERGADVVAGGTLHDGTFAGRADFLVRDGVAAGGVPAPYAVWEATLARRAKVSALLRLAALAEQLAAAGVDPTSQGHLILGTGPGGPARSDHRLGELLPVFRARRDRMLEVVAAHLEDEGPVAWGDPRFVACGCLGRCPDCSASAERHRDVLLVGGVYPRQRAALAAAGVATIDGLAAAEAAPAGMSPGAFAGLRDQAALQLGTAPGDGSVTYRVAGPDGLRTAELRWAMPDPTAVDGLPPASPGDVFFDFEGDPLWTDPAGHEPRSGHGIDYLFGWVTRPGVDDPDDDLVREPADDPTAPPFHGLWADTPAAERDALVTFVDWLAARCRRWPDLHVYHYADYERSHLLSIAARHGTYEDEVDDLLRDGVLVDLWKVVRPALRISHRSRSIKKLEPLYMAGEPAREGVTDGAASIVEYAEYTALRAAGRDVEADERQAQILDYNRYDCVSTLRLLEWLRDARAQVNGGSRTGAPAGTTGATAPPPPTGTPSPGPDEAEPAAPTRRQLDTRRRIALEGELRQAVEREAGAQADHADHADQVRALALLGGAVGYYRREAKPFWHEHFARLESPPDQWPGRRSSMVVAQADVTRAWQVEPGRSAAARLLELRGRAVEGTELAAGAPVWLLYDTPVPPGVEPPPGCGHGGRPRDPPASGECR